MSWMWREEGDNSTCRPWGRWSRGWFGGGSAGGGAMTLQDRDLNRQGECPRDGSEIWVRSSRGIRMIDGERYSRRGGNKKRYQEGRLFDVG
jgi:hypothetical protein